MAWIWTDRLAELLIETGAVAPDQVGEWRARPVAVAVGDEEDLVALGLRLLGTKAA